jgi:hypothetical protein
VVGIALAGRANLKETTAAIVQIHALKVAALEQAQHVPHEVFIAIGRGKSN